MSIFSLIDRQKHDDCWNQWLVVALDFIFSARIINVKEEKQNRVYITVYLHEFLWKLASNLIRDGEAGSERELMRATMFLRRHSESKRPWNHRIS